MHTRNENDSSPARIGDAVAARFQHNTLKGIQARRLHLSPIGSFDVHHCRDDSQNPTQVTGPMKIGDNDKATQIV